METLLISLPDENIAELHSAVEAGEYETSGEALRDWPRKREYRRMSRERLRELWDEGVQSGDAGPVDFAALQVEADRQLDILLKSRRPWRFIGRRALVKTYWKFICRSRSRTNPPPGGI